MPKLGYSHRMKMKIAFIGFVALGYFTLPGFSIGQATSSRQEPPESQAEGPALLNPRLAALLHQLNAGQSNALALFWQEARTNCPMVEPLQGEDRRITFLWRGDAATRRVALLGGMPSGYLSTPLERLPESDIWYLTQTAPSDARFAYVFQVNGPKELPWNNDAIMEEFGKIPPRKDTFNQKEFNGWSFVQLDKAPPQPWIVERPDVPKYKVTKKLMKCQALKAEYPVYIYTPPGYSATEQRCWLMVAFDGGFPMTEVSLNNHLDARKIPNLIVAGVGNVNGQSRQRDLSGSSEFANFVANEVVASVRHDYDVFTDSPHTIIGGMSLGGLMATYCGLHHSDVFGKVLVVSPTLIVAPGQSDPNPVWIGEESGLMSRQFGENPLLPLEFFISVGRYETFIPFSMIYEARRFRDVLRAKGYSVSYLEYDGGHMEVCWRGVFAEGLINLTTPRPISRNHP
jgi:enterochelin esterase family protein